MKMKTKLTKSTNAARQTKTTALNKLNLLKSTAASRLTKVKSIPSKASITKLIKSIGNYLIKILYLDKIEKKTLLFIMSTVRIIFRFVLYTNIAVALFIYLSKILNLEHKFTWELYIYLFYIVYYYIRDYIFDISNRIYSTIRSLMEKLISNLHEVKDTVDNKNNITQPAKDAYRSLFDSGKIDDVQPKHESKNTVIKVMLTIAAIVLATGFIYYAYNYPDELTDIAKNIWTYVWAVPGKVGKFIKRLFSRGPKPSDPENPGPRRGYHRIEFNQVEQDGSTVDGEQLFDQYSGIPRTAYDPNIKSYTGIEQTPPPTGTDNFVNPNPGPKTTGRFKVPTPWFPENSTAGTSSSGTNSTAGPTSSGPISNIKGKGKAD
uniref:Uncharacterized protein n=1 Tax=Porodaedalea pini TaxID=108901 RepID=A0A5B9R975_9AGAM|nr:hypothetical protein PPIT_000113 [Porodaedalea pini]QEG57008.1 hypothetical protein PPIT_000113 [Porodaedalea pini]